MKQRNGSLLDDPSFKSKLARLEIDLKALEYTELRSREPPRALGGGLGLHPLKLKVRKFSSTSPF